MTSALYERIERDPEAPLSVSQIRDKITCDYRHDLKYRRGIQRIVRPQPMEIGSLAHKGLEALFKGEDEHRAIEALRQAESQRLYDLAEMALTDFNEAHEELNQAAELAVELAQRAHRWFKSNGWRPYIDSHRHQWIERQGFFKFNGYAMIFIPDFVLENPDGLVIVWDAKFRGSSSSFATQETADFDLQLLLYQVGLLELDVETHGTATLSVLARAEQPVKLNKNGRPSVSLSEQWCTGDAYRAELAKQGLLVDDPHFENILTALDNRRWVEPMISYRSRDEFSKIWEQVIAPKLDKTSRQRAFGTFECRRCWAREYCLAELRGEDLAVLSIGEREENYGTSDEIE